MKFRVKQIASWLRTLPVLILLLFGLQTTSIRAEECTDFRPVSTIITGLIAPPPQALPPAQGVKASPPERQIMAPGSGASYDIPPQIFLPDTAAFPRKLRPRLPVSWNVALRVQTGYASRAPPNA